MRRRCRLADRSLGAGFQTVTANHRQAVGKFRKREARAPVGSDGGRPGSIPWVSSAAGSVRGKGRIFRRRDVGSGQGSDAGNGIDSRATGRILPPVRTTCTPRSARPMIEKSGSGEAKPAAPASGPGDGAVRDGTRCIAKGTAGKRGSRSNRSRVHEPSPALGASGVSSRDTQRRSEDLRARRLNLFQVLLSTDSDGALRGAKYLVYFPGLRAGEPEGQKTAFWNRWTPGSGPGGVDGKAYGSSRQQKNN